MMIQNQIDNYPYGNIHSSIMEKIMNKKSIEDRSNEEVLLRFQREAEEFRRSRSRYIKNMLTEVKEKEEQPAEPANEDMEGTEKSVIDKGQ